MESKPDILPISRSIGKILQDLKRKGKNVREEFGKVCDRFEIAPSPARGLIAGNIKSFDPTIFNKKV